MFDIEDQIPDNVKDDISILIEKLNDRKHWNDEAKEKLSKLTLEEVMHKQSLPILNKAPNLKPLIEFLSDFVY